MNSLARWAAAVCVLLSSVSARAQTDELPPQVLPDTHALDQARAWPRSPAAARALVDSIFVHLALHQDTEARQEADRFIMSYGGTQPVETARIIVALGSSLAERQEWEPASKWLAGWMGLLDRTAPVAEQIQAHALLGHAFFFTRSVADADREYAQARQLEPKLLESFEAMVAEGKPGLERRGRALTSLGEAYFYAAEKARKKVDAIRAPTYRGGASERDVRRFLETDLTAWVVARRRAIDAAEREYLEVVQIEPAPPPHWTIAAGARVARMWDELGRALREAPLTPAIARDEKLRALFQAAADGLLESSRRRAKTAYETCLNDSVKYQHSDGFSRACNTWLVRNYPKEYHRLEMLGISPDHATFGVPDRGSPLGRDGKLVATQPVWGRPVVEEKPEELIIVPAGRRRRRP